MLCAILWTDVYTQTVADCFITTYNRINFATSTSVINYNNFDCFSIAIVFKTYRTFNQYKRIGVKITVSQTLLSHT